MRAGSRTDAVSVRAEVRFTRDVDLAVAVENDAEAESLVYALKSRGYTTVATVEHEAQSRLATIRQDRIDARNLLRVNLDLDLDCVRGNLRLIAERGYARRQDLAAKLTTLLEPSP